MRLCCSFTQVLRSAFFNSPEFNPFPPVLTSRVSLQDTIGPRLRTALRTNARGHGLTMLRQAAPAARRTRARTPNEGRRGISIFLVAPEMYSYNDSNLSVPLTCMSIRMHICRPQKGKPDLAPVRGGFSLQDALTSLGRTCGSVNRHSKVRAISVGLQRTPKPGQSWPVPPRGRFFWEIAISTGDPPIFCLLSQGHG